MKSTLRQLLAFVAFALPGPAAAQVPNSLLHSIPPPPVGLQTGAGLGFSVAVDGGYAVAGAPQDDIGAEDAGAVKVFNATTGALLFVLPNPKPVLNDRTFGWSVAISGTRVVVGAYGPYETRAGSAYVYDLSSGTPTVPVFTLHSPSPAVGDFFGVSVSISGTRMVVASAGSAYVYELGSATPTTPIFTLSKPGPAGGDGFGWVAISGTRVVAGARGDDTGAVDAGSAYVYDLTSATPTVPVFTLNNPGPADSDNFGYSVAISGTRVVVGTSLDNTGAFNAGSAYVYDLTGATPTVPVATLNNPRPAENAYFGYPVSISDKQVVVGAYGDNFNAGSAYVYDLSSGTPTVPVFTLNNPSRGSNAYFGVGVAISGTHVVVGADGDDTVAFDAGSAYVYDLTSATPTVPVATLNNPGPSAFDGFGGRVAISGTRVVATGSGSSAYVYDLTSGTPTVPVFTLHSPSPVVGDGFGNSVAISGTRVVVGADGDDTGARDAGSAYVFDLSSGTPTVPVRMLNNPGPAVNDAFGYSVAISGTRIVVGANGDDTGATNAGSAYVYDLSSATPTVPIATLNNPSPATGDYFGQSVSISGTRVVVGAFLDDTGASNAGSAYVYDLSSGTPTVPVATLNNPGPAVNDAFGISVAISGTRVVVGAWRDDTGASDAGSVYVYDLSSATPTVPVATLNNPGPGDAFGYSVAISGTRVVVGALYDDTGATDAGSAYVYDLSGATPTVPVATLNNPGPATGDHFGNSVAIDGTTVAIGTPGDDSVVTNKGFAYIFGSNPNDTDADGLLDSWEIAHFGTIAGHSALDDTDGDGHNELLELAFDTDPLLPNPGGLPPVADEGGYLTVTIAKHPGVSYEVQSAGTLLPALPDTFSPSTTTVLTDNAATLKVRDTVLIGTAPARFLRTKVTAAP